MSLTPLSNNSETAFETSNKDINMCHKRYADCRESMEEETSTEEAEEPSAEEAVTSEDEYVDIENYDDDDDENYEDVADDEMSPVKSKAGRKTKPKKNHNHIEKLRRNDLNYCFAALKEAIDQPITMPHIKALSYASKLIEDYTARSKVLDEKIKESSKKIRALAIGNRGIVSGKRRNY